MKYIVKSGQNIYDVALTLYGSIEGIFDLLVSNTTAINGGPLSMTTKLEAGQVLTYNEEFMIHNDIVEWLKDHDIAVRNGEEDYVFYNPLNFIIRYIYSYKPELYSNITENMTVADQVATWEKMSRPRMAIKQLGNYSCIRTMLYPGSYMMIDWGDNTSMMVVEGETDEEIEHQYPEEGEHKIMIYGDFSCLYLDLNDVNGIHYCIDNINVDRLTEAYKNPVLNKLISK